MDVSVKNRVLIFSGILVLFLITGSSIAVANTGLSEEHQSSDILENVTHQNEDSPKLESAPLNPEFVKFLNNKNYTQTASSQNKYKTGSIPSTIDLGHLSSVPRTTVSAPAYYDLRTLNKVSRVQDQRPAGTCWAFAAYASLESCLMPGENWDFSENNMKNLLSSNYSDGFDRDANGLDPKSGGNFLMSTAYLARWSGPINESDEPYNPNSTTSPQNLPIRKHIKEVLFLPPRLNSTDNQVIKEAIKKYGAVDPSIYTMKVTFLTFITLPTTAFTIMDLAILTMT
jgi:C1A family cysteine protease